MDQTLDGVTARWNLLEHSFYQRWTQGTLTRDELCDYVLQYAHVVRAVPAWLEQVRGGDPVAQVGASGGDPESGLYFELRRNGTPFDPMKWVAP